MRANVLVQIFLLSILAGPLEGVRYLGYRFKLDMGDPNKFCPQDGFTCDDGMLHFLCQSIHRKHPHCICFKSIEMTPKLIKTFVEGTNGIRNKFASTAGIANMNLVYWSEQLAEMATRFLRECRLSYDNCLLLGENKIEVTQNVQFVSEAITGRWPGRVVHRWYSETGRGTNTWHSFEKRYKAGLVRNLTNMIFPYVEFIGCGAARYADGYFIVCYYTPAFTKDDYPKNFIRGRPCTKCIRERAVCSKTFTALCGIDMEFNRSKKLKFNVILFVCWFLLNFFYKCLKL